MARATVLVFLIGFLALGQTSVPVKKVEEQPSYGEVYVSRAKVLQGKRWTERVGAGADFVNGLQYKPFPRPKGGAEGCIVTVAPSDDRKLRWLDAGACIDMRGVPSSNLKLRPIHRGEMVLYEDRVSPSLSTYAPSKTYVVQGKGGPDVGPFKAEVVAPPILHLLEPKLDGSPIDRSKDLKLRWNGRGSGEVYVSISTSQRRYNREQDMSEIVSTTTCNCVFKDDGEATIPSAMLKQLSLHPGLHSIYDPYFTIKRQNVTRFTAKGLSDGGTFTASSSVAGNVELK